MDRSKWEYKKLGEVSTMFSGFTPKSEELRSNGKYPYFKVADMNTVGNERELRYTISYIEDSRKYFKKNTIVFPKNGAAIATNKKRILAFDSIVDLNTAGIYADDSILSCLYLYYFLQNIDFKEITRGGAVPTLDLKELRNRIINIPPISDQQRIVAELDCLNEMIAVKQEQLKEFDKLAQSIFYDMFGDPVANEKGWDIIKLGDICSCITKGTTPTTLGFPFVEEGINFVKVESFVDGKIDSSKLTHITHECHQALSRSQLESEDLLICIAGATIGKMAFVDASILPANTNQACAIVRLKDKNNLRFIHYYLALKLKNDIMKMGKGVAQPNLSLGQLRDFTISLPPLSLQQQFADKISAIEAQKKLVKQSIAETQALLDYTMDKYFG